MENINRTNLENESRNHPMIATTSGTGQHRGGADAPALRYVMGCPGGN
jgi:hypothetical protein